AGCPKCNDSRKTNERFIEDARKIHGNKYIYELVEYINNKTKVRIICPKHGEYLQAPVVHLRGGGCSQCARDKMATTFENFVKQARETHGNKYEYFPQKYSSLNNKVVVKCKKH